MAAVGPALSGCSTRWTGRPATSVGALGGFRGGEPTPTSTGAPAVLVEVVDLDGGGGLAGSSARVGTGSGVVADAWGTAVGTVVACGAGAGAAAVVGRGAGGVGGLVTGVGRGACVVVGGLVTGGGGTARVWSSPAAPSCSAPAVPWWSWCSRGGDPRLSPSSWPCPDARPAVRVPMVGVPTGWSWCARVAPLCDPEPANQATVTRQERSATRGHRRPRPRHAGPAAAPFSHPGCPSLRKVSVARRAPRCVGPRSSA